MSFLNLVLLPLKKTAKKAKESISPTKYKLKNLEIRINEKSGDIVIYKRARYEEYTRRLMPVERGIMTIKNIEDEEDVAQYVIKHVRFGPTWHEFTEDSPNYREGYKSYRLKDALYFILGEELDDNETYTLDELLKYKSQMAEHLKDEKFDTLYMISYKDSYKGERKFKGYKLVYDKANSGCKSNEINEDEECKRPSSCVHENLFDIKTGEYIDTLYSRPFFPYTLEEQDKYDAELICGLRFAQ